MFIASFPLVKGVRGILPGDHGSGEGCIQSAPFKIPLAPFTRGNHALDIGYATHSSKAGWTIEFTTNVESGFIND
jgi:hypothetical protein